MGDIEGGRRVRVGGGRGGGVSMSRGSMALRGAAGRCPQLPTTKKAIALAPDYHFGGRRNQTSIQNQGER